MNGKKWVLNKNLLVKDETGTRKPHIKFTRAFKLIEGIYDVTFRWEPCERMEVKVILDSV